MEQQTETLGPLLNEPTIRRWWEVFKDGQRLVEVRILGRRQYSGYYKDIDKLISDLRPFAGMDDEQVYFTLNDIDESCHGRAQSERLLQSPKTTTTDANITRRRWVLVDFDPVRVSGTNSSDTELALAHEKAQTVFAHLRDCGFADPVVCRSGNGWHLLYKCDMPNDDAHRDLVQQFLQALSMMFSDARVDIDEAVFNAARICKLYGTMARKGADIAERPWRMSEIVYVPDELRENRDGLFVSVASVAKMEEPRRQRDDRERGPFDLETFLREHGIGYRLEHTAKYDKFILDHCFFNPEHRGKDASLLRMPSGAIKYVCFHNGCSGHTWQEMRMALDPDAYKPKEVVHPGLTRRYEAPRYEIKQELPQLGGKWLCMSDIEKIDLDSIERVPTGFPEIDRCIAGLHMSEVTILSGSNSSGKSTWLNTLLLNIVQHGAKAALWSGEIRPDILKTWLQMPAAGRRFLRSSMYNPGRFYVPVDIGERIDRWLDGKLFIYNNEYGTQWEQIFNDMNELLNAGVKVFALDNLMTLNIDLLGTDKLDKQRELIIQIKEFAKKQQVHIILVAHPRKVMTFLRKEDISGSSDITNAADNVFIMHRVNNDFKRKLVETFPMFRGADKNSTIFDGYGNVLEIAKNRMYGQVDRFVGFVYDTESRRFCSDIDGFDLLSYGWHEGAALPAPAIVQRTQQQEKSPDMLPFEVDDDQAPF